ncbi:hypothetical protein FGG08_000551 [Glutinoglossum americanum]|uniref:Uncharacterized protein n=1 Tax=Glutinoglossum americanum TaxID=1670608 RepID=A0A9P8ICU2_9PEZI|nr:hypothetical protein FGG08_000551 [Glutinoglossum americanum]
MAMSGVLAMRSGCTRQDNDVYIDEGFRPAPGPSAMIEPIGYCNSPLYTPSRVGLLDMPPEVRRKIYGYLLHCRSLVYYGGSGTYKKWLRPFPLLLLSRRINSEAAEVLYGTNTFHLERNIKVFINKIGKANTDFLRSIKLHWDRPDLFGRVVRQLSPLRLRLRKVTITVPESMAHYVVCLAHMAYKFGFAHTAELTFRMVDKTSDFQIDVAAWLADKGRSILHLSDCKGCCGIRSWPEYRAGPSLNRGLGFLSLPLEIRNIIYEEFLALPHPIWVEEHWGTPQRRSWNPRRGPWQGLSLLLVSRQVNLEATTILYGRNNITLFHQDPSLFFDQIGTTNMFSLRTLEFNYNIRLRDYISPLRTALRRIALLPNLQQVRLRLAHRGVPHLHRIAASARELRDAKRAGGFTIMTGACDFCPCPGDEDITWIIDREAPWGWDYDHSIWCPFEEIMTWKLINERGGHEPRLDNHGWHCFRPCEFLATIG